MARIKLYNRTITKKPGKRPAIPDDLLRKLISSAARWIRCDPKDVPVIVRWSTYSCGGTAHKAFGINRGYALGRRNWGTREFGYVNCDGGWIEIKIPWDRLQRLDVFPGAPLDVAESVWETIVHEFGHILDFREGRMAPSHERGPHRRRRGEISVFDRVTERAGGGNGHYGFASGPRITKGAQEAILNMAIWLEEHGSRAD